MVVLPTFIMFTIFNLACAVAPNWPAFVVFRLFVGINAACPITVVAGLYADIFSDATPRGRAMAVFMASTIFGPLISPFMGGFVSTVSWR